MAGAGYKLFNTGDVLTAAQVNTYLQEQVVMVFANAAARTTALSGVLAEGMVSYLKDTDALEIYSGSAWVGYGSGDITGVTAGTGISGGGTSGTVTITNSMATEITAAGDIIVGTGSGTFDNLPIGTTGQVLTADTTVSPYKVKWASAASGGGMTLLASGDLSGSSVALTSISADYTNLFIHISNVVLSASGNPVYIKVNNTNIVGQSNIYSANLGTGEANNYIYVGSSNSSYYLAATADNGFMYQISNYAATDTRKPIFGAGGYRYTGDASVRGFIFYGTTENNDAVSSLYITTTGTTFSSGKYKLYGVK